MKLRYYQREAVDAVYNFFRVHADPMRNPVIALPTGTGKAIVNAGLCTEIIQTWPTQRVLMLTHVKELIEQNADKLKTYWPQAPLGIYSAGLKEKTAHTPIVFAGIQSAARALDEFGHFDLVFIDECHLVSPHDNADYRKFLAHLRSINPVLRVVGLSATPYRLGLGMITDGGVFTDICYDATTMSAFNRLLDEGFLGTLIPMSTQTILDVDKVHKRGGEFIEKELQIAVVREDVTHRALQEAVTAAADRRHWLVFATGIDHVAMIVRILSEMGVDAAGVHSKMKPFERDDNIQRFKAGQLRVLVNADILTTGFDFPALDCIILLRPTSSPVLHVQILGRGTRPFYVNGFDLDTVEGRLAAIAAGPKQNCLVLDFAGNTRRLGPINDPRIPGKKGEGAGDIPIKSCNACGCLCHISARECPNCGVAFEFKEQITAKSSTVALIVRDEPQVEVFTVDRVTYAPHVKIGFPPSLKVSYYCGMRRFTEWICLEHHGNSIQRKAHDWWRKRSTVEPPASVVESLPLVSELRTPEAIRVWLNKKYPEILDHIFERKSANEHA